MSEPKRYNVEELNCCFDAEMIEHPTGEYVEYSDYARLKTEVERLRKAGDAMVPIMAQPPHKEGSHKAMLNWFAAKEGKPSV